MDLICFVGKFFEIYRGFDTNIEANFNEFEFQIIQLLQIYSYYRASLLIYL